MEPSDHPRTARYRVYGVVIETDHDFTWPLPRVTDDARPDLRFEVVDRPPVEVDLTAAEVVHGVPVVDDEDRPAVSFHAVAGLDVVRIRDAADHYIQADRIVCHLYDPALAYLVEIQLLGMVLALWLERRGIPTLHASVAAVGDAAVAFLGVQGGGKTTAATSLVAAGHDLLVDDLLALRVGPEATVAQPGYPMLRLWPEQVEHFVGAVDGLPLVHPAFTKLRVPIGSTFGSFRAEPVPLRRVYLPRRTRVGGEVTITPLGSADALIALVRDSFVGGPAQGLGLAGGRLRALADVVGQLQVATVRYPDGFDRLPELVAAVEADVAL
jgi:hypothetical protein